MWTLSKQTIIIYVFNKSISVGIFSDQLKYVVGKLLFKKGDRSCIANYGRISVLYIMTFSKIFEITMFC